MMITREQLAAAAAGATLLGSVALVVQGVRSNPRPGRACMAVRGAFGVLALVHITRSIRARQQADKAAAARHWDGYWLGLDHANRGLLVTPPPDTDGQGAPAQDAPDHLSAIPAPKGAEGYTNGKAP
ncbi:hypothetical protein [Streptomyces sp. NPDC008265]|uniref:hypothetical protein n=1 Tax=Streptomyces sp. NPDC008265 TaxID=3364824 RepID=UPI0036E25918